MPGGLKRGVRRVERLQLRGHQQGGDRLALGNEDLFRAERAELVGQRVSGAGRRGDDRHGGAQPGRGGKQ